jgi:WD40 repeat protein
VKLWDLEQGAEKLALNANRLPVWSVAFSPDGKTALSGSDDYKVRVWDLERGTLKTTLAEGDHPHRNWIAALGFSGDGRAAFSASRDGAIKVWNAQDWSFVRAFGSAQTLIAAAITSDGARVVALDEEGHMRIWDTPSGEEVKDIAPAGSDLPRAILLLPEYRLGISGGALGRAGSRSWEAAADR